MSQTADEQTNPKTAPAQEDNERKQPIIGLSPDDDIVVKPDGVSQNPAPLR